MLLTEILPNNCVRYIVDVFVHELILEVLKE